MKSFFLLATAAALVSAQTGQQVANPVPFARGTISAYDGSNRGGTSTAGAADIPLVRLAPVRYMANDGQTPFGGNTSPPPITNGGTIPAVSPNVRDVSNIVSGNSTSVRNTRRDISTFHTFWGQFTDHDLGLTDGLDVPYPIDVSLDPIFDPSGSGTASLGFNRALFRNDTAGVRQQINEITAWIDGSSVYGPSASRNNLLRGNCRDDSNGCKGQLLMNPQGAYGLLPTLAMVRDNNGGTIGSDTIFANPVGRVADDDIRIGGDVRAQENNALESLHTAFAREHNRCAIELEDSNPDRTGNEIFEECRFFTMGYLQNILFTEYSPLLLPTENANGRLGQNLDSVYGGYNSSTRPNVFNEFSAGLFRYGHSELPDVVTRANVDTLEPLDPINLADSFFNPTATPTPLDIDQILAGLWQDLQNEVDVFFVEDVRNQLFQNPMSGALGNDLIAFNLQRGRDHGLPTLNQLRTQLGLGAHASFAALVGTQNNAANIAANLARVYTTVDDVELFIGGVAEPQFGNGNFGETLTFVVSQQYQNFREADNYYFENGWFSQEETDTIRNTVLSTVILRNTQVAQMPCAAMTYSATSSQMMCQNMFNGADSITFGFFTVFATIAAFFF